MQKRFQALLCLKPLFLERCQLSFLKRQVLIKEGQRAVFGLHGAAVVVAGTLLAVEAVVGLVQVHLHLGVLLGKGQHPVQRQDGAEAAKVCLHRARLLLQCPLRGGAHLLSDGLGHGLGALFVAEAGSHIGGGVATIQARLDARKQIGGNGQKTARGQALGDGADVAVDAKNLLRHHHGTAQGAVGSGYPGIEGEAIAGVQAGPLSGHGAYSVVAVAAGSGAWMSKPVLCRWYTSAASMVLAWLMNQLASSGTMERSSGRSPAWARLAPSRSTSSTALCWCMWQLSGAKPAASIQRSSRSKCASVWVMMSCHSASSSPSGVCSVWASRSTNSRWMVSSSGRSRCSCSSHCKVVITVAFFQKSTNIRKS